MSQLRSSFDQLTARMSSQTNLLSAMESDRVALSRAMTQNNDMKDRLEVLMAELDVSRQDRVRRDERIAALEAELRNADTVVQSAHQQHSPTTAVATINQRLKDATDGLVSDNHLGHHKVHHAHAVEAQTEVAAAENLSAHSPPSPTVNPSYLKAFEVKIRNLEDEVTMYKNRQLQADSEVIYLKNALRIREEEAKLLDLTERVGAYRNLEHRFVGAMKQNAELCDRVDQLEHVIMQLQGETETIG